MNGAYTYLVEDREAAKLLAAHPQVWYYHFPADDEFWEWHRGGAWKPSHAITEEDCVPVAAPPVPGRVAVAEGGDNDDDERW